MRYLTADGPEKSFRLAAYAVCIADDRVLLARMPSGEWTLPGGGVDHKEDPFDAVTREFTEETGHAGAVDRLLGVDSRVIPETEARWGVTHQNVGVFYLVRITGGELRPEPNGATVQPGWITLDDVAALRRSSLVDVGLSLADALPPTGHVPTIPVGGLIQH